MKHLFFLVLLSLSSVTLGQELHSFANGEVADAYKINENFESLKDFIEDSASSSCSIQQNNGVTSIACPDGSSATLNNSSQGSACAESDFQGTWIFSGPDYDNSSLADVDFYTLYSNKTLVYVNYECSVGGCSLVEEIPGSWGSFDNSVCSIQVEADAAYPGSAWGFVFLSASKSAVTGFVCDAILGCKAGTLQKGAASGQGKPNLEAMIKGSAKTSSGGLEQ